MPLRRWPAAAVVVVAAAAAAADPVLPLCYRQTCFAPLALQLPPFLPWLGLHPLLPLRRRGPPRSPSDILGSPQPPSRTATPLLACARARGLMSLREVRLSQRARQHASTIDISTRALSSTDARHQTHRTSPAPCARVLSYSQTRRYLR